jgi:hypothetical protein
LCLLLEFLNPFIQDWKFVDNLPIINKTKHPTKGRKKKDGRTPSLGKQRVFQRRWTARGMKTN